MTLYETVQQYLDPYGLSVWAMLWWGLALVLMLGEASLIFLGWHRRR